LYLEFKRKEKDGVLKPSKETIKIGLPASAGELFWNTVFGFVVGFKGAYLISNFSEFKADSVGVLLSGKGNLLAGLILAGVFAFLKYREGEKRKLDKPKIVHKDVYPHERIGDITIVAAISGILGAKLFAFFESAETWSAFMNDPIGQLFSGSGLAIYGGLIVAFIVVFWFVKKKGIPPIQVMDAVAPALIIGYAVGRLGCQLSGDGDWGIVNELAKPDWFIFGDALWAYDYPRNVLERGVLIEGCEGIYCRRLAEAVFPTPIYETVMSLGIFGILWSLRKKISVPGVLFFIYVILISIERYWIEKIRINDKIDFMGMQLTQAEIISVLLFFVGIAGILILYFRKNKAKVQ
jgi:prolipoprotein diacylglyceryl transferase